MDSSPESCPQVGGAGEDVTEPLVPHELPASLLDQMLHLRGRQETEFGVKDNTEKVFMLVFVEKYSAGSETHKKIKTHVGGMLVPSCATVQMLLCLSFALVLVGNLDK